VKVIGLIPFWMDYGEDRDLKKLAGRYLINYSIELLNSSELIDDVIIYSSDDRILEYIENNLKVKYKKRPIYLDDEKILTEQIINEFISDDEADIIVLLHPYCPFMQVSTINKCIENVKNSKFDSAFPALEFYKYAWFKGKPLNFDKNKYSSKLQSLDKIILEQGLMYVFKRNVFLSNVNRIGSNPYIKIIDNFEGLEVNSNKELEIAELIVNSGMLYGQ
jgi:CMP-N-acetylneuraminic acid synthetase